MGRTAKFTLLPKYPLDMGDNELSAALAGRPNSEVIRALLMAEVTAIRAGARREERTMRGLWYSLVKPSLSRAGLLNKKTAGDKDTPWDDLLSKYLAELVRAGETSYNELAIVDGSRQRRPAGEVAAAVAHVELVGPHYPWVILFTEKDTIWPVLRNLAMLYGVSAISGGGQPSNACTDNTVKAILQADGYRGELVVLTLTDFDPAGYSIARAQVTQVQEAAGGDPVHHERLGLEPGQLTAAELAANVYTPKDKGLELWLEETGGIDGRPLGLELDALPLSRLRRMFAEGIERYIDLAPRMADLRAALPELVAWEVLGPEIERRLTTALAAVKGNGLAERIARQELAPGLLQACAAAGWDRIDPLYDRFDGRPLFDCIEDLRAAMRLALAGGGEHGRQDD